MRTTRGWVARSVCLSATGGGVLGGFISVIVNNALIEISLTPFFSAIFGLVLLLLGVLLGALLLAVYLVLGQRTFHANDGPGFVYYLAHDQLSHALHFLYISARFASYATTRSVCKSHCCF